MYHKIMIRFRLDNLVLSMIEVRLLLDSLISIFDNNKIVEI